MDAGKNYKYITDKHMNDGNVWHVFYNINTGANKYLLSGDDGFQWTSNRFYKHYKLGPYGSNNVFY